LYQNYVVSCYQHTAQEQYKQKLEHLPWGIRAKGSDLMNGITFTQVKEKLLLLINDHYPEFIIK
jgi:heptosyltransferase I